MDNYRRVTSVTSTTAGFQSGHPAAHFSSAPSHSSTTTTSSLSTDPTVLAAEIVALRAQLALAVVSPAPSNGRLRTPATRGYCWTHGSSGNVAHTSASCANPAEGHQVAATNRNRMGGSARRSRRAPVASPSAARETPL